MALGPAEVAFRRVTRAKAGPARLVVVGVAAGSGLLVVPRERLAPAAVAVAALAGWSLLTLRAQRRGDHRVLVPDVALVVALCLAQPVIEAPVLAAEECGWVGMVTEVVMVAYQWQFRRRWALTASAVCLAAYVAGALRVPGAEPLLVLAFAAWLALATGISAMIFVHLGRTSRRIDEYEAETEREKRRIAVARAVREAQAEHLAQLHDTVAATLLVVGLGGAGGEPEVLRRQARRDLAVLATADRPTGTDLRGRLGEVAAQSGLEVSLGGAPPPPLPPVTVDSFAGAVGEALRNVARHAGTGRAAVHVASGDGSVRVEVLDGGPGFATGARHGHGIRQSIIGRMERCGGSAHVVTSPAGVLVVLEWAAPGTAPA